MRTAVLIVATTLLLASAIHAQSASEADVTRRLQEKTLSYTGGSYDNHVFKYRLLKPAKIEPGRKYPLVLFLHGAGERGDDNAAQLKFLPTWLSEPGMQERYACFLLAPQCPRDRRWGTLDWIKRTSRYDEQPSDEMKYLQQLLARTIAELPVDERRVYLTGLSMGGYGSWELAARNPAMFAAVAPICGAGDVYWAEKLAGVPVWAWHGSADKVILPERSREMVKAIKQAGGNALYTELEGVGHNAWTPAYQRPDGVVPWLFKQRKN